MGMSRSTAPTTPPPTGSPTGRRCSAASSPTRPARRQDQEGDFTVKIADTSSPITQGLKDFPLKDELYYQLQMLPDIQPLATIEYQGDAWPVAWTRTFGKGRVFHTTLGHRDFGPDKDDPVRDPNLSRLIVQGVEWVAEGRAGTAKP